MRLFRRVLHDEPEDFRTLKFRRVDRPRSDHQGIQAVVKLPGDRRASVIETFPGTYEIAIEDLANLRRPALERGANMTIQAYLSKDEVMDILHQERKLQPIHLRTR
jgi:hypothetical protein